MTKYNCLTGWVAQLAITACLLAERGFTGDTTLFDGDWGIQSILGWSSFKPQIIVSDLGKIWHIDEVMLKAYPCCKENHVGIDLITQIIQQNSIEPGEIETIVVKGDSMLLTPNRLGREVLSSTDCQFSNAYIFALTPYYGTKPGPNWQMPSTYKDPNILDLMKRVKVEAHPRADEIMKSRVEAGLRPYFTDVIVELTAKGKRYVREDKGARKEMGDDEIKAKFRNNASYSSLRPERIERIIDLVYRLDEAKDVSVIMNEVLVNE